MADDRCGFPGSSSNRPRGRWGVFAEWRFPLQIARTQSFPGDIELDWTVPEPSARINFRVDIRSASIGVHPWTVRTIVIMAGFGRGQGSQAQRGNVADVDAIFAGRRRGSIIDLQRNLGILARFEHRFRDAQPEQRPFHAIDQRQGYIIHPREEPTPLDEDIEREAHGNLSYPSSLRIVNLLADHDVITQEQWLTRLHLCLRSSGGCLARFQKRASAFLCLLGWRG